VEDGGRRYDFYDTSTFQWYQTTATPPVFFSPYLNEFRMFPETDQILMTYLDEVLKCSENKLRLAGSILIGSLSELLVLRLVKTIGDYLEDPNATSNYYDKKNTPRRLSFTREMVKKGKERLEASKSLTPVQADVFARFSTVVEHLFDSIKLRRDEYVHPKPETTLNNLPPEDVIIAHAHGFNPYAKALLRLIDIFKKEIHSAS